MNFIPKYCFTDIFFFCLQLNTQAQIYIHTKKRLERINSDEIRKSQYAQKSKGNFHTFDM